MKKHIYFLKRNSFNLPTKGLFFLLFLIVIAVGSNAQSNCTPTWDNCNLINNGDFELGSAPNSVGGINGGNANCWAMLQNGGPFSIYPDQTPDLFDASVPGCTTQLPTCYGIPLNFRGSQTNIRNSGIRYAGMVAGEMMSASLGSFFNQKYYLEFYSASENNIPPIGDINVYFFSSSNPLNVYKTVAANTSIGDPNSTIDGAWVKNVLFFDVGNWSANDAINLYNGVFDRILFWNKSITFYFDDFTLRTLEETREPHTICEGSNVTLNAPCPNIASSGAGYFPSLTYAWSTANNPTVFSTSYEPVVAPTTTTTYKCTTTVHNPLTNAVLGFDVFQVTVTVLPAPLAVINVLTPPCTNGNIQNYSVTQQTGVTYDWSSTLNSSHTSGTSASFSWGAVGGTVTLVATNTATGCTKTSSINVLPCCNGTNSNNQYVNAGSDLSSCGVNFIGNTNPIFINGAVTVTGNFKISNCPNILMGKDASILVNSNSSLQIETIGSTNSTRTTLKAGCNEMWKGIILQDPTSSIILDRSTLQDSKIAIESKYGASYTLKNQAVLNKCNVGIKISNFSGLHPGKMEASYICCANLFFTPSGGISAISSTNVYCLAPYAAKTTSIGMYILGSPNQNCIVKVGSPFSTATLFDQNRFENMAVGISIENSSLDAYNNRFNQIKDDKYCDCSTCKGKAICSLNSASGGNPATVLNVGSQNLLLSNTFTNCTFGVYASNNQIVNVQNNFFNTVSSPANSLSAAVKVLYCKNTGNQISITYNKLVNCYTGLWAFDNTGADLIDFSFNQINNNQSTVYPTGNGIVAQNTSNSAATVLQIGGNKIQHLATGIRVAFFKDPNIIANEVGDVTRLNSPINSQGIFVSNCSGGSIAANSVSTVVGNVQWWNTGIRAEFTPDCEINCNETNSNGFGFQLLGTQLGSRWHNNTMLVNQVGLGLGLGAVLGNQSLLNGQPYPSENQWLGFGSYQAHTKAACNFLGESILNIRSGATSANGFLPINNLSENGLNPIVVNTTNIATGDACNFRLTGPDSSSVFVPDTLNTDSIDQDLAALILGDSSYQANLALGLLWSQQYYLYQRLSVDSLLAISNEVLDKFIDSARTANMQELDLANTRLANLRSLNAVQLAAAIADLSNISPGNLVEQYLQYVQLLLLHKEQDTIISYTASEIQDLQILALQCPYEAGEAVYLARVILSNVIGLNQMYMNPCEFEYGNTSGMRKVEMLEPVLENVESSIEFYPNPAQSILYCNIGIESRFSICDMTGRNVLEINLIKGLNEIDLQTISAGIYFCLLFNDNNLVTRQKLIISK